MTRARTDWAAVMARVPRERFIPDLIWRHDRGRSGNDLVPVDRRQDPDGWAALVAADEPVNTQVDHGEPSEDGLGWEVTSSSSDRRVVTEMLEVLDPAAGDAVLEIGTGTGWNAALLAEAGARVTSIEVDPDLADIARARLGSTVRVVTGDGALGWPASAPYDRLLATVGAARIPPAWVAQVKVGGRLVVPLTGQWQPPGIAVLERTETGAVGRLAGRAEFMGMRGEAFPRPRGVDFTLEPECSTAEVHPSLLTGRAAATAIEQRVGAVAWTWRSPDTSGRGTLWLIADGAWATLSTMKGRPFTVEQAGARHLVTEVLAAYDWWVDQGEPGVDVWRVIVGPDGQRIELA